MQLISNIAQNWIKPENIQQILNKYQESEELRVEARSFVTDKIEENVLLLFELFIKGQNPEEIIKKYNNY